jgi:hypothetical protein
MRIWSRPDARDRQPLAQGRLRVAMVRIIRTVACGDLLVGNDDRSTGHRRVSARVKNDGSLGCFADRQATWLAAVPEGVGRIIVVIAARALLRSRHATRDTRLRRFGQVVESSYPIRRP